MKLAFLTMVWRDYWLLEKWVAHNEKLVPRRQLYVINHGGDPEVDRIADGCNVIHVPRDELPPDLTRRRWGLKGGMTNGLLSFHDMVICTDVDEFIVYAGNKANLIEHLEAAPRDGNAIAPVGFNMVPHPEDGEGPAREIFSPSAEEISRAIAIRDAFARPDNSGRGVIQLDGTMVERLHLDQALKLLAKAGH